MLKYKNYEVSFEDVFYTHVLISYKTSFFEHIPTIAMF